MHPASALPLALGAGTVLPRTRGDCERPVPKKKPIALPALARWAAEESALFNNDGSPFRAAVEVGSPELLVITGENASGKSLLFRVIAQKVRDAGALPVTASIRERTGGGLRAVMMFGDEETSSTGALSVRTCQKAFGNLERPEGCVLALDEPELGLSDGYAAALGRYIGEQARSTPATCLGVVVVTHSRSLVRGLVEAFGALPTFVRVGHDLSLAQWLEAPETRSVEELLALPHVGLERFRWAAQIGR